LELVGFEPTCIKYYVKSRKPLLEVKFENQI
jgi:hypothetical protein